MRYPAYPTYQNSDVSWLGEIPSHWEVRRLKFVADVCNGQDQKAVLDDEGSYLIFGSGGPFGKAIAFLYDQPSVLLGRKGTIDKPLYVEEPFWTVDTMFYTRIAMDVPPKYFFYLAQTIPFDYFSDLTTLPSMTQSDLGCVPFAFAGPKEQQQIAAFLDWKTGQIDALIAKKKDLLEKLKEKRLAVITQAVTKGLDPAVPLRDSCVPWLGKVPKHWEVIPLGFLMTMSGGMTPSMANPEYWEGEIPWVTPKDMKQPRIADSIDHVTEKALVETSISLIPVNSVLIVVRGMILAHSFPTAITEAPVTINQDMKALRCGDQLEVSFLFWCLAGFAKVLSSLAQESAHGTRKVETETLKKLPFPVPPLAEQSAIMCHLESRMNQLDKLAEATERTIARLTEYRTALITAATTGKIDVRGWQAAKEAA